MVLAGRQVASPVQAAIASNASRAAYAFGCPLGEQDPALQHQQGVGGAPDPGRPETHERKNAQAQPQSILRGKATTATTPPSPPKKLLQGSTGVRANARSTDASCNASPLAGLAGIIRMRCSWHFRSSNLGRPSALTRA
eukprot:scaffold2284_cov402-Prasinococcus_capsulatus_cf.AAC.12